MFVFKYTHALTVQWRRKFQYCTKRSWVQYREDICLQTLFLLFKCSKRQTKEFFVSPANSSLVGILITIGDVIDIFAIENFEFIVQLGSISSRFVSPRSLPHTTAGSLVYPMYFLTNHREPCSNRAGFPVIGQFCHLSFQMADISTDEFSSIKCVCVRALPYREI